MDGVCVCCYLEGPDADAAILGGRREEALPLAHDGAHAVVGVWMLMLVSMRPTYITYVHTHIYPLSRTHLATHSCEHATSTHYNIYTHTYIHPLSRTHLVTRPLVSMRPTYTRLYIHPLSSTHLVTASACPSDGCGASLSRRKVPMAVAVHSSALLCRFQHLI